MDKTEEYTIMCEKAEEIQKEKDRNLDMFYSVNVLEYDADGNCWFNRNNKKAIWVPTQDQLQGIAIKISELWIHVLNRFYEYYTEQVRWNHEWHAFFNTPEMMWLAFVMREEFGKVWDGKEWIEVGDELDETT